MSRSVPILTKNIKIGDYEGSIIPDDAAIIPSDESSDLESETQEDVLDLNTHPEDYEVLEVESEEAQNIPPIELHDRLVADHLQKLVILNNLNEVIIDTNEAFKLVNNLVDEKNKEKNESLSINHSSATSASNIENQSQISLPSATDFINRIIHPEIINQDENVLDQSASDVLVLCTQEEDYKNFNSPASVSSRNEMIIPETQNIRSNIHFPISDPQAQNTETEILPIESTELNTKFSSKSNFQNGLLQIIVPFTDFQFCTEPESNKQFFDQTFMKSINNLVKHLREAHRNLSNALSFGVDNVITT